MSEDLTVRLQKELGRVEFTDALLREFGIDPKDYARGDFGRRLDKPRLWRMWLKRILT